ncbi:MAG: hypothetical protein PHO08_09715 [Methylococcales bacterium]|nr:hypothetical protein [Methylococcales bacterium]
MQAIELPVEIDQNHQIHLQLPETIASGKARAIIIYDETEKKLSKPLKLGLFEGKIKISDDFDDPLPDSFWLEGKI